jgi:DNA topoisomerase-6 subunit B
MKRTGGSRTDEILGRDGGGPEGLPHSIIVTPDGPEGEAPVLPGSEPAAAAAPDEGSVESERPARARRKGKPSAARPVRVDARTLPKAPPRRDATRAAKREATSAAKRGATKPTKRGKR